PPDGTANAPALRVHHGKPAQWHALHRRAIELGRTRLAAPRGFGARVHGTVWLQTSCLVSGSHVNGARHGARETDQGRFTTQEAGFDRDFESDMARPVRRSRIEAPVFANYGDGVDRATPASSVPCGRR